tara:strand:+ start:282 stop:545 length:264 start_codon:yes stop_codon:yes gene_type:complete
MAKIKKTSPIKAGNPASQRILDQVYKDINELVDSINYEFDELSPEDGKPGDIKIQKVPIDSGPPMYFIKVRTEEGWIYIRGFEVEED